MMGYSHTLTTTVTLIPGATVTQVVEALASLFDYFGYDGHKAFAGEQRTGDHEFTFDAETGELSVYTNGDVSYHFWDLVSQAAERLGPLTLAPSYFELKDYDTADLDSAIVSICYGASKEAVAAYEFRRDLEAAMGCLANHFDSDAVATFRETIALAFESTKATSRKSQTAMAIKQISHLLSQAVGVYSKMPDVERHRIDIMHDEDACLGYYLRWSNFVAKEVLDVLVEQSGDASDKDHQRQAAEL